MPASGIEPLPECSTTYAQLKKDKKVKGIIFDIAIPAGDSHPAIVVKHVQQAAAGTDERKQFEEFTSAANFPENECRYAVYDLNWSIEGEGSRSAIVFFTWTPDSARAIGQRYPYPKMTFSSSVQSLKSLLAITGKDIAGHSPEDYDYDAVLKAVAKI